MKNTLLLSHLVAVVVAALIGRLWNGLLTCWQAGQLDTVLLASGFVLAACYAVLTLTSRAVKEGREEALQAERQDAGSPARVCREQRAYHAAHEPSPM